MSHRPSQSMFLASVWFWKVLLQSTRGAGDEGPGPAGSPLSLRRAAAPAKGREGCKGRGRRRGWVRCGACLSLAISACWGPSSNLPCELARGPPAGGNVSGWTGLRSRALTSLCQGKRGREMSLGNLTSGPMGPHRGAHRAPASVGLCVQAQVCSPAPGHLPHSYETGSKQPELSLCSQLGRACASSVGIYSFSSSS